MTQSICGTSYQPVVFQKKWIIAALVGLMGVGSATAQAQEGEDTLRIAVPEHESPDLSAEWAYANTRAIVLGNIFERLVTRNPDTNELAPMLAADWEQIDDTTWHFQLREGVRFHDGSEFNAETAAESLNYVTREGGRLNEFGVKGFSFKAIGEHLLEVTTDRPNPLVLERLYQVQIPSAQQLEENPDAYKSQPVGTGPYVFKSYSRGDQWEIERYDGWWGEDHPEAVFGIPEWENVIYDVRPELSTRVTALQAGEVDFAFNVGIEGCSTVGEEQCITWTGNEIVDIRYDAPSSIMGDPRVRRALDLAFNREEIATQLYGKDVETTGQVLSQGATGYNPNIEPWPYDPEKARSLIEEARADGVTFDAPIRLVSQQGRFERNGEVLQAIQYAWQQNLGLDVTISILNPDQYDEVYRRQDAPMHESVSPDRNVVIVTTGSDTDLFDLAGYGGSRYLCGGDLSVYCDEDFDQRWAEAIKLTGEERGQALAELNAEQVERNVWSGILRFPTYHAVAETVEFRRRPDGWVMANDFTRQ
ncbi:ABC transporter substrate-binding protein [Halomonas ramblicola]|uniref:ABC transporter substrate-binding protein n=1 Tax=Halomonas ramblicola TaxID=747349 RepID=UPI0025B3B306|nr:ABC transporter substrate-binding protein [Halomonas ramblicola]MDN3520455.1 ABC transporter substrate-binding protein [Halomonas ramblicola]